jgi:hypothetical protein
MTYNSPNSPWKQDGNGTVYTPPGIPGGPVVPTTTPVKIHDGTGVPKDGWMNGGTVVKK